MAKKSAGDVQWDSVRCASRMQGWMVALRLRLRLLLWDLISKRTKLLVTMPWR